MASACKVHGQAGKAQPSSYRFPPSSACFSDESDLDPDPAGAAPTVAAAVAAGAAVEASHFLRSFGPT